MNNPDFYIYVIAALLPFSAGILVLQVNPYHALALRGILGAVAAMLYAILGAADVSLTEALMGTLLAITLYAIAVRSSLVMTLGILEAETEEDSNFEELMKDFRRICDKRHMRLEVLRYTNTLALQRALMEKEVHATCHPSEYSNGYETPPYHTVTRVKRLYDIMQAEFSSPATSLNYVNAPEKLAANLTEKDLEEQRT
jgi:putative multicomponent Na+:H+ antiporter subunit B